MTMGLPAQEHSLFEPLCQFLSTVTHSCTKNGATPSLWPTLFASCGFWTVFYEANTPTITQKWDNFFFPLWFDSKCERMRAKKQSLMFVCYAYIYSFPLIPCCSVWCMGTLWPCTIKYMHYSNIFPLALLLKLPVWIFLGAVTAQRDTKLCQVIHSTQQPHRRYFRSKTFIEEQWKALNIDTSDSQCLCSLITLEAPVFLPCLENRGSVTPADGEKAVCMGRSSSSMGSTPE